MLEGLHLDVCPFSLQETIKVLGSGLEMSVFPQAHPPLTLS